MNEASARELLCATFLAIQESCNTIKDTTNYKFCYISFPPEEGVQSIYNFVKIVRGKCKIT